MVTVYESTVTISNDDTRANTSNALIRKMSVWRQQLRGDDLVAHDKAVRLKIKLEQARKFKLLLSYKDSAITLTQSDVVLLDNLLHGD